MTYRVTLEVDVDGPDWPEDKQVPKDLTDWPAGVREQVEGEVECLMDGALYEIVSIEVDPEDEGQH